MTCTSGPSISTFHGLSGGKIVQPPTFVPTPTLAPGTPPMTLPVDVEVSLEVVVVSDAVAPELLDFELVAPEVGADLLPPELDFDPDEVLPLPLLVPPSPAAWLLLLEHAPNPAEAAASVVNTTREPTKRCIRASSSGCGAM
jgi:hypothetical protein